MVDMPKITWEGHYTCNIRVEYEWKPPSQTSRGVPVGLKVGFKPHKEYRRVSKKRNASSSGNKKKDVEHTIEVSNSNPFEVLNSVDNDVKLAILMDEAGNPLKKVEFSGDYDSEYEVASVDNDMARSLASERVDFGNQSLLEQWKDSYGNGDYDEDPYDDGMYEGQDLSQEIQAICDNLDIRVRGRKKENKYLFSIVYSLCVTSFKEVVFVPCNGEI
ncbi:hypothetical protein Tco_1097622 [Tanacetum coccineum]